MGFGLAGNFSCEVTADAPLFSTGTAYNQMQVIGEWHLDWVELLEGKESTESLAEMPKDKPKLVVESQFYEPGNVLRANCSSPPSRPRTVLTFTLNNQVVSGRKKKFGDSETTHSRVKKDKLGLVHIQCMCLVFQ